MKRFRWLLQVSRPRFWPYLFGPYLIGIVAAPHTVTNIQRLWLLLIGLYFTFSANLLVYGINDIYDYETDKSNPKKQGYEALVGPKQHRFLLTGIALSNLPFMVPFLFWNVLPISARIAVSVFLFLGIGYSAPPVRAKVRPGIDSMFNALYVFPALVSYGIIADSWPPLRLFLAAVLWCMAMHAYSAVPDIKADKKAKIKTIATALGARKTILFCLACYLAATLLSVSVLGVFAPVSGTIYVGIMFASLMAPERKDVFKLYKLFPVINLTVGFGLFWYTYFVVK